MEGEAINYAPLDGTSILASNGKEFKVVKYEQGTGWVYHNHKGDCFIFHPRVFWFLPDEHGVFWGNEGNMLQVKNAAIATCKNTMVNDFAVALCIASHNGPTAFFALEATHAKDIGEAMVSKATKCLKMGTIN